MGGTKKHLHWVGEPGECVIGVTDAERLRLEKSTGLRLQRWV